jgi:predicted TIM-barrel fold metal-dependent hydrolase
MIGCDYFEQQAFAGAPLTDATVIDAHAHMGDNQAFPFVDTSAEAMVATMDRIGVDVACVSSVPAIYGQSPRGNDEILAAIARYHDRFFGYVVVDIGYPDRMQGELDRCLAGGVRGVKIHSHSGLPYNHANYDRVYDFAAAHGLPLLAHTWSDAELDHLEPQFSRCPNVNFVLGHAGAVAREHYVRLGREYPNVYLELCFSACPRGLVEYFVGEGLAAKMLWGSDCIFMSMEQQIGKVLFARISEGDKRLMLGQTAARVLLGR